MLTAVDPPGSAPLGDDLHRTGADYFSYISILSKSKKISCGPSQIADHVVQVKERSYCQVKEEEGQACTDPGARTPFVASGNFVFNFSLS